MVRMRLIDSDKLVNSILYRTYITTGEFYKGMAQERDDILGMIKDCPTVEQEKTSEVNIYRYNDKNIEPILNVAYCSGCKMIIHDPSSRYCSWCGCKLLWRED